MATLAQINTAYGQDLSDSYPDPGSHQSSSSSHGYNLLSGMTSDKKLKADGQPPKRRGPKPDSKPAMTRRQELNRQAQRTHRERKEHYVKAIEVELTELKGVYARVAKERTALKRDVQHLRDQVQHLQDVLAYHGIDHSAGAPTTTSAMLSSSESFSGSYGAPTSSDSLSPQPLSGIPQSATSQHQQESNGSDFKSIEYNQAGIDFVLALERPCMDHIGFLVDRSSKTDGEISGHARMITCPTHEHVQEQPSADFKLPDMEFGDLNKLLDLSNRLPMQIDSEITPIMAWSLVVKHSAMPSFDKADILAVQNMLLPKVRCYGFGAVLEDFEVNDAIWQILVAKSEPDVDAHPSNRRDLSLSQTMAY